MISRINSRVLYSTLLGLSLAIVPLYADAPLMAPPMRPNIGSPGAKVPPELSKEDLAMLQEVEQEINKFVESLPPEEQKKFWGEVDELTKVMSTMSEDELINFMETALAQEAPAAAPQPAVTLPPTQVFEPTIAPIEVHKSTIAPSKQEAAIELIDGIITRINNFLLKAQSIPEMSGKIKSWGTKGKLTAYTANSTWNTTRAAIEEFEQKLHKMKDRDSKTKEYKYLEDFIKNEALYNNLIKVRKMLDKNEPLIEVGSFGLDRMESASREATINVLNILTEANTVFAIPAAIDTIIEKYEPTAKKLKENEELSRKQALEASKRPSTPTQTTIGRSGTRDQFGGTPPWYGKDTGYPSTSGQQQRPTERTKEKGEEGKKQEAPKETGKEKGAKEAKPAEKKKREEDKLSDEYLKDLRKSLDDIIFTVEDHKELEYLQNHFSDPKQPVNDEVSSAIGGMKSSLSKGISSIKQLKRQVIKLSDEQRREYVKDLRDITADFKKNADKFLAQVNQVQSQQPVISIRGGDKAAEKYWAYMGGADPKAKKDVNPRPSPGNLLDFREKMKDFEAALSNFDKAIKTSPKKAAGIRR